MGMVRRRHLLRASSLLQSRPPPPPRHPLCGLPATTTTRTSSRHFPFPCTDTAGVAVCSIVFRIFIGPPGGGGIGGACRRAPRRRPWRRGAARPSDNDWWDFYPAWNPSRALLLLLLFRRETQQKERHTKRETLPQRRRRRTIARRRRRLPIRPSPFARLSPLQAEGVELFFLSLLLLLLLPATLPLPPSRRRWGCMGEKVEGEEGGLAFGANSHPKPEAEDVDEDEAHPNGCEVDRLRP